MDEANVEVVVGIDGSEASIEALRWAAAPNGLGLPVRPVLAWEFPIASFLPAPMGGSTVPSVDAMQRAATEAARTTVDAVGATETTILDPIVREGSPATVLLGLSDRAALIVVGCRGLGRVKRALLGSTSREVVYRADVPVALVPDSDEPVGAGPRRIVVGIDDSDHATHALRWATRWARPDDELSAVCAWEVPHGIGYDVPQFDPENLRERARDTVHAAIEASDGTGRIIAKIAEGDPRTVLDGLARDADLLVIGARGRTGLAHLALGSTTSSLIARPAVPTVVVP